MNLMRRLGLSVALLWGMAGAAIAAPITILVDFNAESGDFMSQYDYVEPAPNGLTAPGTFTIGNAPQAGALNSAWYTSSSAPSPGGVRSLIVNGKASDEPQIVWAADLNVAARRHHVQFDLINLCCADGWQPSLNIGQAVAFGYSLDGGASYIEIPPGRALGHPTQPYTQYEAYFESLPASQVRFALFNGGAGRGDGDFAIYQIAFRAVPEPSTWAMMILGFGAVGATLRNRALARRHCAGTTA